ncbi:MAG: type II secretion system protein [Phycisphaeraceae bacterium]
MHGFTLLELLVVISIMMVLVGIGATLGPAISGRGSDQMTRTALSVGESALTEYRALTGRWPDIVNADDYPVTRIGAASNTITLPINDRETFEDHSIERFVARTLQTTVTDDDVVVLRRRSSLNSLYEDLSDKVLTDEDTTGDGVDFLELRDGWGKKLLYVPPMRTIDPAVFDDWNDDYMYFLPLRDTPYFVSAGSDGEFGDVHAAEGTDEHEASLDNLYSYDVVN